MAQDINDVILGQLKSLDGKVDELIKANASANTVELWKLVNAHERKFNQQKGAVAVLAGMSGTFGAAMVWIGEHLFSHH